MDSMLCLYRVWCLFGPIEETREGDNMALIQMSYHSKAINCMVPVNVILPEIPKTLPGVGAPEVESYKTLYLFHGLGGDHTVWMRRSNIERYATKYNLAVVMPEVGRSWYTDTCYGIRYFTFVTEELPNVCRSYFKGMSAKREDNLVAGYSMGGYGALKAALHCPDKFFGCISLSGALDITRKGRDHQTILPEWRAIFDHNMQFLSELEGSEHDLYATTRRRKAEDVTLPKLYLWCGTEDFLITANRQYRDLLEELEIAHIYKESEGDHSWPWWDLYIQDGLKCILEE